MLNSTKKVDVTNTMTINWSYNSPISNYDESEMYHLSDDNFYINRKNINIYNLLIQRPLITKDALEKYSNTICYVDTDSIATKYVDTIFDYYDSSLNYPYFVEGIYDYLLINGRGGPKDRSDLSTTLEHPSCDLFGVNQYVRQRYRQTGYYVAGQNTIKFLDEWYWMCNHPKIFSNLELFAPYNEETIANVLLWKYNILDGLPYIYCNGGKEDVNEIYNTIKFNGHHNNVRLWLKIPSEENKLLFFHGEKNPENMDKMIMKLKSYFNHNIISSKNWGDIISHEIIEKLSGKEFPLENLMHFDENAIIPFKDGKLLCAGSTMRFSMENDYVWGAGCIKELEVGEGVKKIYAVRGPLTRNELLNVGRDCPEIYGDPGLLFPLIYNPDITPKYEYGIIPHFIDFEDSDVVELLKYLESIGFKIINITAGLYEFIDELKQVKNVISSSLHGIIAADAYGIPNARIKLTNDITGGDFKYYDYLMSVKRTPKPTEIMNLKNFKSLFKKLSFEVGDTSIKNDLLENAPWKDPEFNLMSNKLKILFIAPHLSTGGMPSFLLKRIESLLKYEKNIEIFVVEYSNYSMDYVVHRNKIMSLIPSSNFFTLGRNKTELISIIKSNKIDIIHIDEMIEGFDSFNKVSEDLMSEIYRKDRSWRVVETCHNVWFNPKTDKKFHPDAYAYCTPFHEKVTFADMPSYGETIEFPIEYKVVSSYEKRRCQKILNFDESKVNVINVGLWTSGKNQKEGIEIARRIEKSNPEFVFHFIGNQASNFREYWEPIMNNLPSNVKIWGERSDVEVFMSAADIFMFNSTWECNPLVLREAISHGLKILARNLPQYLDMFTPYITPINDNLNKTIESIIELSNSDQTYILPENQNIEFSRSHYNLYNKILNSPAQSQTINTNKLRFNQHFVGSPFFEILGDSDSVFTIKYYDENNTLHYNNDVKSNHWVKLNREYYTKWRIEVLENGKLIYDDTLDYKGKKVYIAIDSRSLGDNIAWIPYCLEFKNTHKCEVIVSTFWNHLFKDVYPELVFIEPNTVVNNIYGMYKIGWFYNDNKEPEQPNVIPLQKAASNILGLPFKEIKPRISIPNIPKKNIGKYVTIATNSTAGCKFWTKEGWQETINHLVSLGYQVIDVSKEGTNFDNISKLYDTSIENTISVINNSEFFIGLSSGLSWLSWAIGKHVIMISNFTEPDHEFTTNCTRIINKKVCNGCWNDPSFKFDKGDWYWCPLHKNTERHFECHKKITSKMVISEINKLIKKGDD
jgi:autotransporter strand-loop-strand O-heptosyltransferase